MWEKYEMNVLFDILKQYKRSPPLCFRFVARARRRQSSFAFTSNQRGSVAWLRWGRSLEIQTGVLKNPFPSKLHVNQSLMARETALIKAAVGKPSQGNISGVASRRNCMGGCEGWECPNWQREQCLGHRFWRQLHFRIDGLMWASGNGGGGFTRPGEDSRFDTELLSFALEHI